METKSKKFSFNPNTKSKWIMERIDFKKFIIMTVLFVLSSVQVVDRVRHYISAPILSETMVIKEADFTLPAITICNSIVWHTKDSDYLDYYEIDKFWSMDPDRLSTISSVKLSGIDTANQKQIMSLFQKTMVTTGPCLTLSLENAISHQTRMARSIELQFPLRQKVFVHTHSLNPFYDFNVFGRHLHGCDTTMSISFKQVEYYNSSKNHCVSEAEYNNCKMKCYEEEYSTILGCRLPFMSPIQGFQDCQLDSDVLIDLLVFMQDVTYKTDADCSCRRSCRNTLYTVSYESSPTVCGNSRKLVIQFRTRFMIGIREYLGYTFESLVSDVGSIMSLFMGFSLLTVIESIEKKFMQVYMKRSNTLLRIHVAPK